MKFVAVLLLATFVFSVNAEDACHLPVEVGNCRGMFPRFYYNDVAKKCEIFYYGGCKGNENNFPSEDHCKEACGGE